MIPFDPRRDTIDTPVAPSSRWIIMRALDAEPATTRRERRKARRSASTLPGVLEELRQRVWDHTGREPVVMVLANTARPVTDTPKDSLLQTGAVALVRVRVAGLDSTRDTLTPQVVMRIARDIPEVRGAGAYTRFQGSFTWVDVAPTKLMREWVRH